jgi:hypothetical protein
VTSIQLRRWHSYLGLFIAPSICFFSLTGAVQLFNLHEKHGDYNPAVLVEKLSAVHKDQVFEEPHEPSSSQRTVGSSTAAPDSPAEPEGEGPSVYTLLLKWFFLLVSVSLVLSTSIGVWMGFTQLRKKWLAWTLMGAGTLMPVVLLVLSL